MPALGEAPESYDAALIRRVMLAHLEHGSRVRARVLTTSLRMYLRFLAFEGRVLFVTLFRWNLTVFDRTIPSTDCLG